MVIKAKEDDILQALREINEMYDDNVDLLKLEPISKNRFRVRLTVKDSSGRGARIGYTGRRVKAACWHVHGDFFNALLSLNPDAVIKTGIRTITSQSGNWRDWNIGSVINPLYFSEACNCM